MYGRRHAVIVAICLDDHKDDNSWYHGPPYPVDEKVFDEADQGSCYRSHVEKE